MTTGARQTAGYAFGGGSRFPTYEPQAYETVQVTRSLAVTAGGNWTARYRQSGAAGTTGNNVLPQPNLAVPLLTPGDVAAIVPDTLRLDLGGATFQDKAGQIESGHDWTNGNGALAGSIDYEAAVVSLLPGAWADGAAAAGLAVNHGAKIYFPATNYQFFFRTPGAPVAALSFHIEGDTIAGERLTADADVDGNIVGTKVRGFVDHQTGIIDVSFGADEDRGEGGTFFYGEEMLPDSIRFNAVLLTFLPLDAELLGLDTTRLPLDGRVPIFRKGKVIVIHNSQDEALPSPLTAGQTVALSRSPISYAILRDAAGLRVSEAALRTAAGTPDGSNAGDGTIGAVVVASAKIGAWRAEITAANPDAGDYNVLDPDGILVGTGTVGVEFSGGGLTFTLADGAADFAVADAFDIVVKAGWTVDTDLGQINFNPDALDLAGAGYVEPLQATHRQEDMLLATNVQINGQITVGRGVAFNYAAGSTFVSSALSFGDLGARVTKLFTQKTWTNVWDDARIGDDSVANFNDVVFPLVVTNKAATKERWAIKFTGSTSFEIIGEQAGVIGTGTTGSETAPVNPISGLPYFTIPAGGWGAGWVTNNVLRFNTEAGGHPLWLARTTLAGEATTDDDDARIELRGDAD